MKRALLLVGAAAALAGCAGWPPILVTGSGPPVRIPPPVRMQPSSPTEYRFSTAANRRFARRDVQALLRIVVLPPEARLVLKVPKSAPTRFRDDVTGTRFLPGIAVARRIWIVHEPLEKVRRYIQAHAHSRPRPEVPFREAGNGIGAHPVQSIGFQAKPGHSWDRWLNLEMTALTGGGTVVVVQAGDAWVHTPPRSEIIPGATRRIDITSRYGNLRPNVIVHVRNRFDIAWIVARANGLGLANAEHVMCAGLFGGPTVTLRFSTADGRVLARARVADSLGSGISGPCNPVSLTIRGRMAPPLIGMDILRSIQQLLNIDLAPPQPSSVASCLRRAGWKAQTVTHNEMLHRAQHFPPELTASKNGRRWTITFHSTGKLTVGRKAPHALHRCLRPGPYVTYG